MWHLIHVSLFVLMLTSAAAAGEMRWPNPHIAIPPLVHQFIVSECRDYQTTSHESVDACILGERYGYRAVVMMLMEDKTGERAAERYRACRNGVGDLGGRFHRNRAVCIGAGFSYKWRFEFSQEAAVRIPAHQGETPDRGSTRVATGGPSDLALLSP